MQTTGYCDGMRPYGCAALTAMLLGALSVGIPFANAEPVDRTPVVTTVPEHPAPPGQTLFTDSPAIVDPHPQTIESWSRQPDPNTIAVNFTSGTPQCFGVHAEVQETTDLVAVKLTSGTLPEAVDRACILIGVFGTLTVGLDSPIGNRAVVSLT